MARQAKALAALWVGSGLLGSAGIAIASSSARELAANLAEQVVAAVPQAIEARHQIHQHPELSYQEQQTAALVAEQLRALGLEVRTGVARTGVIALLRGGRPGPTVAVRADMDALPVVEAADLPLRSSARAHWNGQEVGVAHACGHDLHTAIALGVAAALAPLAPELPGSVKFLFQPAEEGAPPGERQGAEQMRLEGALEEPRPGAIFALHSDPGFSTGEAALSVGPAWAAVDQFVARIRGRQAHGALPEQGVDPIVISAQAILALQTIRSRNLPAHAPSVVTVGIVRGGERFNIVPGEVTLEGTVRSFDPEVRTTIERRMREILAGITAAGGGGYELDYKANCPVTVNDPALAARLRPVLERTLGAEHVHEVLPMMAGEDFAFYTQEVPGFYFRLGVNDPEHPSGGLHTPEFRADDGAIAVGIRALTELVVAYLSGER